MRFPARWSAALAAACLFLPAAGAAQVTAPSDLDPPTITITPGNSSYTSTDSVLVQITWIDDMSLNPSSRRILYNGVNVTSSFSYAGNSLQATSQARVKLVNGTNVIRARIGDNAGRTGDEAIATYTYTAPPPPAPPPPPPPPTPTYTYGVQVTPDGGDTLRVTTGGYWTAGSFTVTNTGTGPASFLATGACTAVASGTCTATRDTVSLAAGESQQVGVQFTVAALVGAVGNIRLKVSQVGNSAVADSGWVTGKVVAAGSLATSVSERPMLERSECPVVSLGGGGASECGDLRLAHALPAVRTMNKVRAPVLLYNSAHAEPWLRAVYTLKLPAASAAADSVVQVYTLPGGPVLGRQKWNGWAAGESRRLVFTLPMRTTGTGLVSLTMQTTAWRGGVASTTTQPVEVPFVNRSNSPFGAGWWLAGLEQLVHLADARKLWVSGDGSARVYMWVNDTTFVTANPEHTDTMRKRYGPNGVPRYVRILPGGGYVTFNATGQHDSTVSRTGVVTSFAYTGARLDSIRMPGGASYSFEYGATARPRLWRVKLQRDTVQRVAIIGTANADPRISGIQDPDGDVTNFEYASATDTSQKRILRQRDPRQVWASFQYDSIGKVTRGQLEMGQPGEGDDIIIRITPGETRGAAPVAAVADSVYTLIDGPRPDSVVLDRTRIWIDPRHDTSLPVRMVDALGNESLIARGDARFPGLVTRVDGPVLAGGVRSTQFAAYDARGNLRASTSVNPLGDGRDATVWYDRGNTAWPDYVTRVTQPTGELSDIGYDGAGNRQWQQDGRGTVSRTTFTYNGQGQVIRVVDPNGQADSVTYDAAGNLRGTRTALGFWSYSYGDALGRDTLTVAPIGATPADTARVRNRTVYDISGNVKLTQSFGPGRTVSRVGDTGGGGGAPYTFPAETLTVRNTWQNGMLTKVERWSAPDRNGIGIITTTYRYDAAGRKVAEVAPGSTSTAELRDSTLYDQAGNAVWVYSRRGLGITMEYDALNRLTRRVLPNVWYAPVTYQMIVGPTPDDWTFPRYKRNVAGVLEVVNPQNGAEPLLIEGDDQRFTYDAAGRMLTAVNRDASVRRRYSRGGLLLTDTLKVRTHAGSDTTAHVYGLGYSYDLSGRRLEMRHPLNLKPSIAQHLETAYTYEPLTGALSSAGINFFSVGAGYTYRSDGQLDQLIAGTTQTFVYDADGRQVRRTDATNSGALIHQDSFVVDARGKSLRAYSLADSTANDYSGLGALVHSYTDRYTRSEDSEELLHADGMSNVAYTERINITGKQELYPTSYRAQHYQPGTGRLLNVQDSTYAGISPDYAEHHLYDRSGNDSVAVVSAHVASPALYFNVVGVGELRKVTMFYYDAAERLRVVDKRSCLYGSSKSDEVFRCNPPSYTDRGAFEEYRYDALGRRIWVRSRKEHGCELRCNSSVTRTVWDGDQVLYEIRAPGGTGSQEMERDTGQASGGGNRGFYGRVAYVHGAGIDRPAAVIRMDYDTLFTEPQVFYPLTDARGRFDLGMWSDGMLMRNSTTGKPTRCVALPLPIENEYVPGYEPYTGEPNPTSLHQDSVCVDADFPAPYMWSSLHDQRMAPAGPPSWMGSQIEEMRDASGLMYRRNRYYDPSTGRFTQEDPIGIAGGINLYGYANGDPVSYNDPSGLCPPPSSCLALAGGASVVDGPLPVGDLVGLGLLGAAAYYALQSSNDEAISTSTARTSESSRRRREGEYVYRALSPSDRPEMGLMARNPAAGNSPLSHVAGRRDSQWISTTKSLSVAMGKYGGAGSGVVRIDLSKVLTPIVDLSRGIANGGRFSNYAKADQEVLIQTYVPPQAIQRIP